MLWFRKESKWIKFRKRIRKKRREILGFLAEKVIIKELKGRRKNEISRKKG